MGEVGQITDLTNHPQTISLSHTYKNPVVLAQPLTRLEGDSAVVRLTNVQPDSFTLYIQEAPGRDGVHTQETVSYLVLEAGRWQLADGTLLEVGQVTTDATTGDQWASVEFETPFESAPVVFSQAQTENDPHWVKTRQRNTTGITFEVALEEEEAKSAPHGSETIGWLAIPAWQGKWGDHIFEAGHTENVVTDNPHRINFEMDFAPDPRFVAAIATFNDPESAHLRVHVTSSEATIRIEEDKTLDLETTHPAEVVGYLVLEENGSLPAFPQ